MLSLNRNKLFALAATILLIVAAVWFVAVFKPIKTADRAISPSLALNYNYDLFYRAVREAESVTGFSGSPVGGILPHHDLAGKLVADLFQSLNNEGLSPELIVILGPKHDNEMIGPVTTCDYFWREREGLVETDEKIIADLIKAGLLARDCDSAKEEYSVSNLLPYVREYFPDSRILPILFTTQYAETGLAEWLVGLAEKKRVFFLASLDFAHYLSSEQVMKNNEYTLSLIENFDLPAISRLTDAHVDSVAALSVFLSIMKKISTRDYFLAANTEAGEFLGRPGQNSTSYLSLLFLK